MTFGRRNKAAGRGPELAPVIDIVLVMVIFFMVLVAVARPEAGDAGATGEEHASGHAFAVLTPYAGMGQHVEVHPDLERLTVYVDGSGQAWADAVAPADPARAAMLPWNAVRPDRRRRQAFLAAARRGEAEPLEPEAFAAFVGAPGRHLDLVVERDTPLCSVTELLAPLGPTGIEGWDLVHVHVHLAETVRAARAPLVDPWHPRDWGGSGFAALADAADEGGGPEGDPSDTDEESGEQEGGGSRLPPGDPFHYPGTGLLQLL